MIQRRWRQMQTWKGTLVERPAAVTIQRYVRGWRVRRPGGLVDRAQMDRYPYTRTVADQIFAAHRVACGAAVAVAEAMGRAWVGWEMEAERLRGRMAGAQRTISGQWERFYQSHVSYAMQQPLPRGLLPHFDAKANNRPCYVHVRSATMTYVHPSLAPMQELLQKEHARAQEILRGELAGLEEAFVRLRSAHVEQQEKLRRLYVLRRNRAERAHQENKNTNRD